MLKYKRAFNGFTVLKNSINSRKETGPMSGSDPENTSASLTRLFIGPKVSTSLTQRM